MATLQTTTSEPATYNFQLPRSAHVMTPRELNAIRYKGESSPVTPDDLRHDGTRQLANIGHASAVESTSDVNTETNTKTP